VNQLPFVPVVVVRIINIHFCIYSMPDQITIRLNVVLKIEVHLVQTNNDSIRV